MKTRTIPMMALALALSAATCLRAETPKTGDKAPEFAAKDQDGKIAHITDNPSADVHLNEMTNAVANLAKK